MQVSKKALVKMFQEIGCLDADSWDDRRLSGRAKQISQILDDDAAAETPESKKLLKRLKEYENMPGDIELTDGDPSASEKSPKKKGKSNMSAATKTSPNKKTSSKKTKVKAKAAKKPGKNGSPDKKASKGKRVQRHPGVIAEILGFLKKASKDKPVTKADIFAHILKKFPGRDSAQKTINAQIPAWLSKKHGVKIKQTETKDKTAAFWI